MKIEACLFDLDGVVVDTAKYHFRAWRKLAENLGFDFDEANNEKLKGVSRMESLDILLHTGGIHGVSDTEKEEMAEFKNRLYLEYISTMTPDEILPGVTAFLEDLKSRGVRLALGSASKNAMTILRRIGLEKAFDEVVDGTKVSKAKPDPEVFQLGAELLGVVPAEAVVFEDAQAGIEAAVRAGMWCVGVGNPALLARADTVIPGFEGMTLRRLKELLEKSGRENEKRKETTI